MPFLGKIDAKEEKRGVLGKKCFQLGNYFFPTRNPYLEGYSDFVEFLPYFRSEPTYNRAENRVKRFYI